MKSVAAALPPTARLMVASSANVTPLVIPKVKSALPPSASSPRKRVKAMAAVLASVIVTVVEVIDPAPMASGSVPKPRTTVSGPSTSVSEAAWMRSVLLVSPRWNVTLCGNAKSGAKSACEALEAVVSNVTGMVTPPSIWCARLSRTTTETEAPSLTL